MEKKIREIESTIDFAKNKYQIDLDTSMGTIRLDFFPDVAPMHCKNMIALAKSGFYDGLIFHRVIDGFVIQGGCPNRNGTGGPGYRVKAEFNSRKHVPGTLSMARAQDPNSAGSQFFLCLKDVPFLDNQYTVFGQTADESSLNTVLSIGKVKTGGGDRPVEDVTIKTAKVLETPL
jgi:peptidyl-prolyl cis-trans isomerase B (cyclophilin B)